jgi:hypothetical protein
VAFETRGDANDGPDPAPIAARHLLGKVRWRILGLGSLVEAFQERRVQAGAVGLPIFLLVGSELLGLRSRRVTNQYRAEIERLRRALITFGPCSTGCSAHSRPMPARGR